MIRGKVLLQKKDSLRKLDERHDHQNLCVTMPKDMLRLAKLCECQFKSKAESREDR